MSGSSAQLNALSVRCNRDMPCCNKCLASESECIYPTRQKRKVTKPAAKDGSNYSNQALTNILERLQKVEQHCDSLPSGTPFSVAQRTLDPNPEPAQSNGIQLLPMSAIPSEISSPGYLATPYSDFSLPSLPAPAPIDATSVLYGALEQVEKLMLRSFAKCVITDEVRIPKEVAKLWLSNFFDQMFSDLFLSLIDRKLIEMVPDLLEHPQIHLDAGILVIYYATLWQGGAITATLDRTTDLGSIARLAYLGCLRALPLWQREATGTYTDLLAAIAMSRMAGDSFDYELAWKMHKQACEYAQALDLHNLDDGDGPIGSHHPNITEENRKGFWGLIQIDAFFRLLYNKPPLLTGDVWKVNLPWFNSDPVQDTRTIDQMLFIVSSRVALVTLQFFANLEEYKDEPEVLVPKTEALCLEVVQVFDEWKLPYEQMAAAATPFDAFTIAEAALTAYTSIIFMLRKMTALDSTSPAPISTDGDVRDSPVALVAACHLTKICSWLLDHYTHSVMLSWTFGMYRAYAPLAYVISHILRAPDVAPFSEEIEAVKRISMGILAVSKTEKEMVPLANSLRDLNEEIQKKVRETGKELDEY
ncbi:unnamed protein product [Clonostachys solani]|uniref:Transcription factor domain-containing protein n=1 Tax=Clonostachys solani TaxID=160281 RepID=A0A9P0ERJ3_9HYPO|nr:unnamed protein product [Clonostachys solani]